MHNPKSEIRNPKSVEPRWRVVLCFLLLLAFIQVALGPHLRLSQWDLKAETNAGVAEADAWFHGRLDIPQPGVNVAYDRMFDTAVFNGKCYNVFPPLIGFLTLLLAPLHQFLLGSTDRWLPWPYVLLSFWPLPILAFRMFRIQLQNQDSLNTQSTNHPLPSAASWAALLTASYLGGTALLPCLWFTRVGHLGFLNHVLSQIGLLLIAHELLGRRRLWLGLIGLAIATWSRQLTLFYALPILWCAFQNRVVFQSRERERPALGALEHNEPVAGARGSGKRRIIFIFAALVLIITPLLTLNYLKFNNPLDFGYRHIYTNRVNDWIASRAAAHGLFSLRFLPENVWYMHLCPPRITPTLTSLHVDGDPAGTGIWATTPLLLLVILAARQWWSDPARRSLMLASLLVMLGGLLYHNTGFVQVGYHRFALDFIPIWLAVITPYTRDGWRAWFTIACTTWSLLYFSLIPYP